MFGFGFWDCGGFPAFTGFRICEVSGFWFLFKFLGGLFIWLTWRYAWFLNLAVCDMLWLLRVLAFWAFRYLLMIAVYLICVIWLFSC